ncbi:M48 family metallopeptidase [Rickettsiales bacterium LUAb2]
MTNISSTTINFNNHNYIINIKKIRNAKSIKMKPNFKNNTGTVTIPYYCSYKQGINFASTNIAWLANLLDKHCNTISLLDLQDITILGKTYAINLVTSPSKLKITITDQHLNIIGETNCYEKINKALITVLKKIIKNYISNKVDYYCQLTKVTRNKISLKDCISKWGSCSSLGNLSFNWRLVFAPLFVLDYIICHEVAHLTHFNHSNDFWQLVKQLDSNYLTAKHWLKLNGNSLHNYSIK